MIYHVKTMDDQLFVFNTETLRWGRASTILTTPSITAAEKNLAAYEYLEEGDMVPQGDGTYNLDPRTIANTQGKPGAGFTSVGLKSIPLGDTLVNLIKANVPLKEDSFSSNPIKNFKYVVMGDKNDQQPVLKAE